MTITGPTWVYHRTEPPRLVRTQAEYDALGKGWADSPAVFTAKPVLRPVLKPAVRDDDPLSMEVG
jgi:hypothetical protein